MRKLLLSTAIISVGACTHAYGVEPFTATALASFCSSSDNVLHMGQCDAYLMGAWDATILLQAVTHTARKDSMICDGPRGHPTPEDMRAAFNMHASRVRIPVNEPAASAALNALMDAYPCKE